MQSFTRFVAIPGMDLPDSLNRILGGGNGASAPTGTDPDPEEQAAVVDGGQQLVTEGAESIQIEIPDDADVDTDRIEAALSGQAGRSGAVNVKGEAGGDTTVTPVASGSDVDISDSAFDLSDWEYRAHLDDRVGNLMDNRVTYNQQMGSWILSHDDLVPGIMVRLKSLMLGDEGLSVEPDDPDSDADQRMADHMRSVYDGDADVEAHVDPRDRIDMILEQNVINAVWVGRSTDLHHLDVDSLKYVKDGETGEELYIQDQTSYTTFDIPEDGGEPELEVRHTDDRQALEIGEQVLDVRLYRTPPLQAIADDVVNKLQLKRLQGRKAEIASIGGIIIRVEPPAWLNEEDYGNYIAEGDDKFGSKSGRLLELVMAQQIDSALETLQSYQTATVMSVPENWKIETVELPEMNESMADMIRGYNEAIARRLLLPLDLLELEKGSELSRNSMMAMFMNTVSGWQGQITDMFDSFARIQKDIHGMSGSVNHTLPMIEAEDEQEIMKLFNFAGLLGLSEAESRELANTLEGVELDTDPDDLDMDRPDGGPDDPEQREAQIQEIVDESADKGPEEADSGPNPEGRPPEQAAAASVPDDSIIFGNVGGDPFGDEDVLESFVQDLLDAGADGVWLGDEQWPDHSGIHDRPVSVTGLSMDEVQAVWDRFSDESAALTGPKPVQASLPDGWQHFDHVEAAHSISAPTMREAAVQVRDLAERQTPEGYSTEMRKLGADAFAVLVRDRDGNFQGSIRIRESPTDEGQWVVVGADEFVFAQQGAQEAAGGDEQ